MQFDIHSRFLRQAQDERDCISPRTAIIICHCESIPDREGEAISTDFINTAIRSIRKRLLHKSVASPQR